MAKYIDRRLFARILQDYCLDPAGIHGVGHWLRVIRYGMKVARKTKADRRLVMMFGLLHDSCRLNDGDDLLHGQRAATYVRQLIAEGVLKLTLEEGRILFDACAGHTDGLDSGSRPNATVRTCWDADKLDLHRFDFTIDTGLLLTAEAVRIVQQGKFINVCRLWDDLDEQK